MQLQQLRYVVAAADCGSISLAAKRMFVSQSVLSVAIRDVEAEAGITVFTRGSRGVTLTPEGVEFLGYARQVVQQADLLEERYGRDGEGRRSRERLVVSSQHYAFSAAAFRELMARHDDERFALVLNEARTRDVIATVRDLTAEVGVLYLSDANRRVITRDLEDASASFTSLFRAIPRACVSRDCPLARRASVRASDLAGYCRLSYDQGDAPLSYAEEPLGELPCARRAAAGDMLSIVGLLQTGDSYLITTGVLADGGRMGVVAVPVETDERMDVGFIRRRDHVLGSLAQEYLGLLARQVTSYADAGGAIEPSERARELAAGSAAAPGAARAASHRL